MSSSQNAQEPIRRVTVVAKLGPPEGMRMAVELEAWLRDRDVTVRFDAETSRALGRDDGVPRAVLPPETDLAIVAGGDGTLLTVARAATPLGVPILGVNLGTLGFLTELQREELYRGLEAVLAGNYTIEERTALRVRFTRGGEVYREYALLNDAVVTKSALARMITLHVRVNDEVVGTFTADGLIISTPTGSTAYNLSAGGPILDPHLDAFLITPICPHSLAYRPLVVPGDVSIHVKLLSQGEAVYLTLDGQVGFPMEPEDELDVVRYPRPVRLVRVLHRGFFEILRRKLRWGER